MPEKKRKQKKETLTIIIQREKLLLMTEVTRGEKKEAKRNIIEMKEKNMNNHFV